MGRIAANKVEDKASARDGLRPAPWTFAVLLALIALAVWGTSFSGAMVFDDLFAIRDNVSLRDIGNLPAVLDPPYDLPVTGRPFANLTFAINYALGGTDPFGYHLVNVAVHLLAGLALFGLLRRTLISSPLRGRFGGEAVPLAFTVALLWLLHPLQTSAVTYLTQRTEVLASFFYLAALYAYARSAKGEGWSGLCGGLAVAAALLGAASKEITASLPLLALLYDRTFLAGTFAVAWSKRKGLLLALASTWILTIALALSAGTRGDTALSGVGIGPVDYALTQFGVVVKYLGLVFWPNPLILDYGMRTAGGIWQVIPQAALILLLLGATVWALKENRPEGFCGALFFLVLAPTSSIIPIRDPIFEHRMYLPLAPLITLTVAGLFLGWIRLAKGEGRPWPVYLFCAFVATALAVTTIARNGDYRTPLTIWLDTANKQPDNARAWGNVGNVYFSQNNSPEAERYYQRSVELDPGNEMVLMNLGLARMRQGKVAEALENFARAVKVNPLSMKARFNYGKALVNVGRLEQGFAELKGVAENPLAPPQALALCAEEFYQRGRFAEALRYFERAAAGAAAAGDAELSRLMVPRLMELRAIFGRQG